MRIVHVANFYGPGSGGVRTFMHAIAQGYLRAGHEPVLIVPGPEPADEILAGVRRITVPGRRIARSGGYRAITDLKALIGLLETLRPDRLEVSDRLTLRPVGHWAAERGIPSVCIAHERVDGVLRAHGRMPRRIAAALADRHNRETARSFDLIVATTGFAAAEFERIGARNLSLVPLGCDLEQFRPANRDDGVREGYLEHPDQLLLVCCSRLSTEKRPDLAVNTLRELRRRGLPARLVMVGSGPAVVENRIRRLAGGLPVMFAGFVPDRPVLAGLLASADVVLAPGPIETFGLAALEALASGTPVVGSKTSALAEILGDGGGAVAEPAPRELADAVQKVLARPAGWRRAQARQVAERYSWQNTVDRFIALHGLSSSGVAAG